MTALDDGFSHNKAHYGMVKNNFSVPTAGKQSLCALSFVYRLQVNLTVWTELKLNNIWCHLEVILMAMPSYVACIHHCLTLVSVFSGR